MCYLADILGQSGFAPNILFGIAFMRGLCFKSFVESDFGEKRKEFNSMESQIFILGAIRELLSRQFSPIFRCIICPSSNA